MAPPTDEVHLYVEQAKDLHDDKIKIAEWRRLVARLINAGVKRWGDADGRITEHLAADKERRDKAEAEDKLYQERRFKTALAIGIPLVSLIAWGGGLTVHASYLQSRVATLEEQTDEVMRNVIAICVATGADCR